MTPAIRHLSRRAARRGTVGVALLVLVALTLAGCAGSDDSSVSSTSGSTTSTGASGSTASAASLSDVLLAAGWSDGVTLEAGDGSITYTSNGIPNHARQAEYALPNAGVVVPSAATAQAGADPTVAQSYSFTIPTTPTQAAAPTDTSLGTIGLMISGAALFNPYEGDNSTVAAASNFTVKNSQGQDVAFLDSCSGHPTPMGEYHYHALPKCVSSQVDTSGGPSHIIGVAFDGYPIYGNRDVNGDEVSASKLDACNGLTSPTPEFPDGIYHYVLLDTTDSNSSIRCFTGEVDASLTSMPGMARP